MMNYPNIIENESDISKLPDDDMDPLLQDSEFGSDNGVAFGGRKSKFKENTFPLLGSKRKVSKSRL